LNVKFDTRKFNELNKEFDKISRTAFPLAVRKTLSDAAFYTKKKTLLDVSQSVFTIRQKNFFKANSKAESAKGMTVNQMYSVVGMYDNKLKPINGRKNYAVSELEEQETGGVIDHKTFIPMKQARKGGRGIVKEMYRYSDIPNLKRIITAKQGRLKRSKKGGHYSKKQAFIRAAIMAKKTGSKFFIGNKTSKGTRTLFYLNNLNISKGSYTFPGQKTHSNSKIDLKVTPIYNVKGGRSVSVKRTNFMRRASHDASLKIDGFFMENARVQFERIMKKL